MAKKVKGFYRYISRRTGRFVRKGTRDAKRVYALKPKRSKVTGRFVPAKRPAKSRAKPPKRRSKIKPIYLGTKEIGFQRFKRRVYSIPLQYGDDGLEISREAIETALKIERKRDPNAVVTGYAEATFRDTVEDETELDTRWFPVTGLLFVDRGVEEIIYITAAQKLASYTIEWVHEFHLQFQNDPGRKLHHAHTPKRKHKKR